MRCVTETCQDWLLVLQTGSAIDTPNLICLTIHMRGMQVERLQRKFASIHSTLAQQGAARREAPSSPRIAAKKAPAPPAASTAIPAVVPAPLLAAADVKVRSQAVVAGVSCGRPA